VNNPIAIVDRETGAIEFLYCINYARCYSMRSTDDGLTWTAPIDITATFIIGITITTLTDINAISSYIHHNNSHHCLYHHCRYQHQRKIHQLHHNYQHCQHHH
jgi:hypothetical protein